MFTTPQTYTTSSKWQVGRSIDGKCAEVDTRRNRRCPTWVWLGCAASTLLFKKQILAIGKRHWHGSKPSCSNFWDDFHRFEIIQVYHLDVSWVPGCHEPWPNKPAKIRSSAGIPKGPPTQPDIPGTSDASAWQFCLHHRAAQSWNHFLGPKVIVGRTGFFFKFWHVITWPTPLKRCLIETRLVVLEYIWKWFQHVGSKRLSTKTSTLAGSTSRCKTHRSWQCCSPHSMSSNRRRRKASFKLYAAKSCKVQSARSKQRITRDRLGFCGTLASQ